MEDRWVVDTEAMEDRQEVDMEAHQEEVMLLVQSLHHLIRPQCLLTEVL